MASGTLAGVMGMRFYNSGKFMPAGLIAGARYAFLHAYAFCILNIEVASLCTWNWEQALLQSVELLSK